MSILHRTVMCVSWMNGYSTAIRQDAPKMPWIFIYYGYLPCSPEMVSFFLFPRLSFSSFFLMGWGGVELKTNVRQEGASQNEQRRTRGGRGSEMVENGRKYFLNGPLYQDLLIRNINWCLALQPILLSVLSAHANLKKSCTNAVKNSVKNPPFS